MTKARSGSSWSVRRTSTTSPAPIRISVWSWRCRAGPWRTSPKRASSRRASGRSMSLDPHRHGRADRALRPVAAAILHELLELHHPEDEALGTRRAARHVDVHRHDPVDALDRGVGALVAPTRAGAVTHRDAPLRLGHLLPEAKQWPRH